jgi:nucleoid-associated protein YgaU
VVEDFIQRAQLSLAAKLPQSPLVDPVELTRLQNEKASLLQENAMLRSRVAELEKAASVVEAGTPTAEVMPTASSPPASTLPATGIIMASAPMTVTAESSPARVHVVQRGDTLQSLALRYYGTRSSWERIYQANRNGLFSKDQLKIGQSLVIP